MALVQGVHIKIFFACLILFSTNISMSLVEYKDNGFVFSAGVPSNNKKVLLLYTGVGVKGGSRTYKINLYKHLLNDGFGASFFIVNNADVQKELTMLGLPFYAYAATAQYNSTEYWQEIYAALLDVCSREPISIVMANKHEEVLAAKKIKAYMPVKIVLTLHVDNLHKSKFLSGVDGVLAVAPHIAQLVKQENKKNKLGIKVINWAAPLFDADKFLTYQPTLSKEEFFLRTFNIKINNNIPIVCMVGNFLANKQWKDHKTLLMAIHKLVYEENQPIQLVLAGDGPQLDEIKKYSHALKLDSIVYFLGYTSKVPDLLYYSDVHVLISKHEAFGISLLEAALMKKPLIGVRGTGMENVIKDGRTGLLIGHCQVNQLVAALIYLINNEDKGKQMGKNAQQIVIENFMPDVGAKKIEDFLNKCF